MGCQPSLTCAPYLGHAEVSPGQKLAWCESSAIVYANSVVGARCQRFPEFLDLCAALTGRVPDIGLYRSRHRRARVLVVLDDMPQAWLQDPWFFEALGVLLGQACGAIIPAIEGLPSHTRERDLCALGAAAAASGALDLFHAIGLTPEAPDRDTAFQGQAPEEEWVVRATDIEQAAADLDSHGASPLTALCLGAPHAWAEDGRRLLRVLAGRRIHENIRCYFTTNPAVLAELEASGELAELKAAGVRPVTGRCTYYAPTLPGCDGHVATTSAKWAWYAQRHLDCGVSFLPLQQAVDAACRGSLT